MQRPEGLVRVFALSAVLFGSVSSFAGDLVEIGSRRELFVDRLLVDRTDGVTLRLHHPKKAATSKSPLPVGAYATVLVDEDEDGRLYQAYWRGFDRSFKENSNVKGGGLVVCYAESRDGIEWRFPKVGVYDVQGSQRNVILANMPSLLQNFSPMIDTRPDVPVEQRYKALAGHPGPGDKRGKAKPGIGLFAFYSGDGIHWTLQGEVIPYQNEWRHAFDSQNVAFWSDVEQQYVCYFRTWTRPGRLRSISRTTSLDFVTWTKPVETNCNRPGEHLYTNQTHPYFRAPHIYIATPTRFVPGRGDQTGASEHNNATDVLLMTTRAGHTDYDRTFGDAFIRPGLESSAWTNRSNYVALNVVETSSTEMSIYHRSGDRYVLRTDGFASAYAGFPAGELVTRPFCFRGDQLHVNLSTSAAGSLRIELQQPDGTVIPDFKLKDCPPHFGDAIDRRIRWGKNAKLSEWSGKPVRLRFVMQECDLYSFKFEERGSEISPAN